MAFEKGHEKIGGREAGTVNKFTGTVKDVVLEVFARMGGVDGLHEWAMASEKNKRIFYAALMKMLPRELYVGNQDSPESLPFRIFIEGGNADGD